LTRAEILKAAERCVCADRNQQYGEPEDNFRIIAALWNVYLFGRGAKSRLNPADVGAMMALFKLGRIATGGDKADNFIDLAGYAACAGEISTESGRDRKDVKCSVENKWRTETQKTGTEEKTPHKTTFAENKNVRMARGLDGTYIVTTGCTVMEAPSLAEAMRIIAEYEHTGS
jgi:hypothetical protein